MNTSGSKPSIGRHALALLAFPVIGLVVAILWLIVTTKVFGIGTTGFGNAAIIFVLPVLGGAIGAFAWLPLWFLHERKFGPVGAGRAVLFGLVLAGLISLVFVGPSGFSTRGGAALFGYAILATTALAALAHVAILNWRRRV